MARNAKSRRWWPVTWAVTAAVAGTCGGVQAASAPATRPASPHEPQPEKEPTADDLPSLIKTLKDRQQPAAKRLAACVALRKLGSASGPAVPALVAALGDPAVSTVAADALADIGPDA